eukprot:g32557.t1
MNACLKAGIPMAPTIFAYKGKRSPAKLLKEIKARGWKTFVMKQSMMAFSLGFCKLKVEECEKDTNEPIPPPDGRIHWPVALLLFAQENHDRDALLPGDDIPEEFLENAKRIGKEALKVLPELTAPSGELIPMMPGEAAKHADAGTCPVVQVPSFAASQETNWDPEKRTFFLNEIEYGGTTYFIRHLKEDFVPKWAELYAEKAREIAALQEAAPEEPQKKRARMAGRSVPGGTGAARVAGEWSVKGDSWGFGMAEFRWRAWVCIEAHRETELDKLGEHQVPS